MKWLILIGIGTSCLALCDEQKRVLPATEISANSVYTHHLIDPLSRPDVEEGYVRLLSHDRHRGFILIQTLFFRDGKPAIYSDEITSGEVQRVSRTISNPSERVASEWNSRKGRRTLLEEISSIGEKGLTSDLVLHLRDEGEDVVMKALPVKAVYMYPESLGRLLALFRSAWISDDGVEEKKE